MATANNNLETLLHKDRRGGSATSPKTFRRGSNLRLSLSGRLESEIVDGLRIKAAKRLGIQEVPVILDDEWTHVQVNKEKRNP